MTFSICTKKQDGSQNLENPKFFRGHKKVVPTIQKVEEFPEIALAFMVFSDKLHFLFLPKIQDAS